MSDEQEGVSSRQLLAAFFAVVVLCAVFFSLGFFLGHKEGSAGSSLATEQVPSSSDAPPALNSPEQPASSDASASPATAASADQGNAAGRTGANASPASAAEPGTGENSAGSDATGSPAPASAAPAEAVTEQALGKRATAQPVALQTKAPARVPMGSLVQVAALGNQQDANNMVSVLQSRGYPALMLTPEQAHASDNLFRVVAGPYKTRAESEKARTKLAAEGFKPFIRP